MSKQRGPVSASGLAVSDRAGPAWPPNPSLLSTGPGPARPPTPHFYRQGLGRPGPQALTFIDKPQAGPAPQPLTSIGQTPHFYQPDPSLLSAKPARPNPKKCEPPEPPVQLLYAKWQTLSAHC